MAFPLIDMQTALNQIKKDIENAIRKNGEKGKNSLIKTQKPINLIHNVIKTSFLNEGIHPSLMNPDWKRLNRVVNPSKRVNKRPITLKDKELVVRFANN